MYTTKTASGTTGSINYHAQVPFLTKPKIIGEEIRDGVRYYLGEGKEYIAERFDLMFKTVKGEVLRKARVIDLNDVANKRAVI